jgi:hypothetical protein
MQRRQVVFSRVILIVLVLSIIGLLVAAILGVGKNILSPDGDTTTKTTAKEEKPLLLTNIPDERVEMTVRGSLVADEDFRSYTISVSQKERTMNVYKGYKNDPNKDIKLYNNSESFTQFVYALERINMAGEVSGVSGDTRGICATGELVTFKVYNKGELKKTLWASTCDGSKGNMAGDVGKIQKLFSRQIPEYSNILKKTGLN